MKETFNMPEVWFPTDKQNFYIISAGSVHVGFSYETAIAVLDKRDDICASWVVSANESYGGKSGMGSVTTGKHLNWFSTNKASRLPRKEFEKLLETL